MPHLFETLKIKDITLRNRIGLSPMCTYSYEDGFANDWLLVHLGTRAAGGAGLIIAEATAVEARGRISAYDLGIWSDAHIVPLERLTRVIKQNGAVAGIQIAHAGRKAGLKRPWDTGEPLANPPQARQNVGPSPIAFNNSYAVPHQLTVEEIHAVQDSFRMGAQRALEAGFEWLEIHAAHGYLLHSFYSPISNQRNDEYGGSFENRIRFLLETTRAIRGVWPERLPLTIRISGTDWTEGGWSMEESVKLAKHLKTEGVDLLDCSSGGGVDGARIPVAPGYQVPIAEAVRREAGIPTAAVGLITDPVQADEIIRKGQADLVLLGRELLRNPYWPLQAAQQLEQPAPIPPQYLRAF
jgi:2,4-dienoyl-CoA reductase-like NADH-dependent reductase (Old Yellow Enzyme family)